MGLFIFLSESKQCSDYIFSKTVERINYLFRESKMTMLDSYVYWSSYPFFERKLSCWAVMSKVAFFWSFGKDYWREFCWNRVGMFMRWLFFDKFILTGDYSGTAISMRLHWLTLRFYSRRFDSFKVFLNKDSLNYWVIGCCSLLMFWIWTFLDNILNL